MLFRSLVRLPRAEQQPVGIDAVLLADLHNEAGRRVKRTTLVVFVRAAGHAEQLGKINLIEALRRTHLCQSLAY